MVVSALRIDSMWIAKTDSTDRVQIKSVRGGWVFYVKLDGQGNPTSTNSMHENGFRTFYEPRGM